MNKMLIRWRYRVCKTCFCMFKWLPQLFILIGLVGYLSLTLLSFTPVKENEFYIDQPTHCVECPGENGEPVYLNRTYNRYPESDYTSTSPKNVSEYISLWRSIPDSRDPRCKEKRYPEDLPNASVIFVIKNERLSLVLRSVYSVLLRTPRRYLKEIILIDDNSDTDELKQPLADYCAKHFGPVVKIYRSDQNMGLIAAKVKGARLATGQVIVFLDAHVEVNQKWLEPLLTRIKETPNVIANPIIDVLDEFDLSYTSNLPKDERGYGEFSWRLNFIWTSIPERILRAYDVNVDPYPSATMAGGLLAMRRNYFFEIGAYDEDMESWGAENLEQSFRTWMCGGRIEFVPCSRVAHMFRTSVPYSVTGAKGKNFTLFRNNKRLTEIWLDQYKRLYKPTQRVYSELDAGDLSNRRSLRRRLKCKSFKWYLDNICPEKYIPDEHSLAYGLIKNPVYNVCLNYTYWASLDGEPYPITDCSKLNRPNSLNYYSISRTGQLMLYDHCFKVEQIAEEWYPMVVKCSQTDHKWRHDRQFGHIINIDNHLCLELFNSSTLRMAKCDNIQRQAWQFDKYNS